MRFAPAHERQECFDWMLPMRPLLLQRRTGAMVPYFAPEPHSRAGNVLEPRMVIAASALAARLPAARVPAAGSATP